MSETSTKPYFIRALHEWCCDNGYTPHIVVQVDEQTRVPQAFVSDGQITLNLGLLATNKLTLGNEFIDFQARFGGVTENLLIPVTAVSAIFARETGAGMGFEVGGESNQATEDTSQNGYELTSKISHSDSEQASQTPDTDLPPPKRPHLSIVK